MAVTPIRETGRSSVITSVSIALVAYALCDMIHEVLGHGTAILCSPGVTAVSLTTVAISSLGTSRVIAAAGSLANLLAGMSALLALRFIRGSGTFCYFVWLLATLNLFNATAYPVYSGILNFGDWQVVIAHLQPQIAWRIALVVFGLAAYSGSVYLCAIALRRLVEENALPRRDVTRVVISSYMAGGVLFVAGAALNPIGIQLIWLSGIASGFGAMGGLLWIPGYVTGTVTQETDFSWKLNWAWLIAGMLVAVVFVFVIGRGVRL